MVVAVVGVAVLSLTTRVTVGWMDRLFSTVRPGLREDSWSIEWGRGRVVLSLGWADREGDRVRRDGIKQWEKKLEDAREETRKFQGTAEASWRREEADNELQPMRRREDGTPEYDLLYRYGKDPEMMERERRAREIRIENSIARGMVVRTSAEKQITVQISILERQNVMAGGKKWGWVGKFAFGPMNELGRFRLGDSWGDWLGRVEYQPGALWRVDVSMLLPLLFGAGVMGWAVVRRKRSRRGFAVETEGG